LAKGIESELAATGPRPHYVEQDLGSPGTDDPKHLLAELLCALGLPCDYS